ncbi:DUF4928 family protein [Cronobacter sakazakii]
MSSRRANDNDPHNDREGVFQVGTTAFHLTTAPMENLISHCIKIKRAGCFISFQPLIMAILFLIFHSLVLPENLD